MHCYYKILLQLQITLRLQIQPQPMYSKYKVNYKHTLQLQI